MINFREKTQVFLLGLMFGLLLGGGFFILKLDDYFKELNFYKSLAKTFTTNQTIASASKEEQEGSISEKDKKETEHVVKTKAVSMPDSSLIKPNKDETILDTDTLTLSNNNNDSLRALTENTDDIIVKKDELLNTKTLEINNLSLVANRNNTKDSLLQKVSGIKENSKQLINVEFWQSPLNYKGYKMTKFKIVVYGIDFSEALKVYSIDDAVYLKNNTSVYKLDNSSDFKPYERITDENIISKLK